MKSSTQKQTGMTAEMRDLLNAHGKLISCTCEETNPHQEYWQLLTHPGTDREALKKELEKKHPGFTYNPYREIHIKSHKHESIEIWKKD